MRRVLLALLAISALSSAFLVVTGWRSFGRQPDGARRERLEKSVAWHDGSVKNPEPMTNYIGVTITDLTSAPDDVAPRPETGGLPTQQVDRALLATPPASGLRITWLGHSTMLLEMDGKRIITDPIWSERASPFGFVGPTRWAPPLIALSELPAIDAVIVSHDHYDHLDAQTLTAMSAWPATTFIVPLGLGAHLEYWGVPAARISELDWWQETSLDTLKVVATPARHASGRFIAQNETLWAGFAFIGPQHRVYYSGDTGIFPALREIGERLGPFDLTMIESGQYGRGWPDWHLGPEYAVDAHQLVRGRVMLPVHWAMFQLAYHSWTEPIERVLAAAAERNVTVIAPRLGQSVEPAVASTQPVERWWPKLPWKTAAQDPLVATGVDELNAELKAALAAEHEKRAGRAPTPERAP